MSKKALIEQANTLLKAAKEKPEQFKELTKTFDGMDLAAAEKPADPKMTDNNPIGAIKKDDMPHAANSPEDKAHDVSEHTDCIPHAMKVLDTPDKQKAMLAHLRTLHESGQERSEQNKEIGMADKGMSKAEVIEAAKKMIEMAKSEPAKFEELTKAMAAPAPAPAAAGAKPAAPKMPAPAPAMMKPKAPGAGGMRMSKDEIRADLAKPWAPKHPKKMGAC